MAKHRLLVFHDGQDISDSLELKNGKGNPFGWSQHELHYQGHRIGWLESGYPESFEGGYTWKIEDISG